MVDFGLINSLYHHILREYPSPQTSNHFSYFIPNLDNNTYTSPLLFLLLLLIQWYLNTT